MFFRTMLILSLLGWIYPLSAFAQTSPTDTATTLTVVQINTTKPREISPVFYGIANPRSNNYDHPQADVWQEQLKPILAELKPQHLRGPSGTGGNFWLWREGRHMTPKHPQFKNYYGWAPNLIKKRTANPTHPLILDKLLSHPIAMSIPYVFSTNTISQSLEDNVALAGELTKHFPNQKTYIELGNELYAIHYKQSYPRAKDYFDQARKWYKAIKQASPNTEISVVAFNPV